MEKGAQLATFNFYIESFVVFHENHVQDENANSLRDDRTHITLIIGLFMV